MVIRRENVDTGLRVQQFHNCEKPSMVVDEKRRIYTTGWGPFKKTITTVQKIYETNRAKWTCPACKSRWHWAPGYSYYDGDDNRGMWVAEHRTSEWVVR